MKERTKQLQSSGETRKTNRTWHFLSTLNSLLLSKLLLLLIIPAIGSTAAWATSYTPSADEEIIILNQVYDNSKSTSGYSKHDAIAWGGTTSSNSKKAGDPSNGGAATSSNVNCYSVKGNGEGKNITVSITGVSKIIIYHESNSSAYVELRSGSKSGTVIGTGSKQTYYTEVDLVGTKDYSGDDVIFLHGTTKGSDDQDFYVYAIKLVKADVSTYTVKYNANLEGITGSVPTDATYVKDATVTVLGNTGTLAKSGYTFLGWSTASGYQSSYYTAGQTFTMGTADVNLYAQWKIDGSISSSPASTVVAGDAITTTASSSATITGMYISQAGGARTKAELLNTTERIGAYQSGSEAGWGVSGGATLGTGRWVLSALLTDGTFYSDVLTNTFSVGVAAPVITCANNTVTMTCATDGATIYYTTNGSTPTSSSPEYDPASKPTISENTTIKAIAYKTETTYSSVATQNCTYAAASTALPVTFDFTTSPWSTSTDFSDAVDDDSTPLTILDSSNSHNISFYGNREGEFSIKEGSPNYLQMTQNGTNNHFIAIPISGINGRIDVTIGAPYTASQKFIVKAELVTGSTAVTAPSDLNNKLMTWSSKEDNVFKFRIEDISEDEGVLYIGVQSSNFNRINSISITSPASTLVAKPTAIYMADNSKAQVVNITNYSFDHNAVLKTIPACVDASFDPSTGELTITPKAIGTGSVVLALDEDGNGTADVGETKTVSVDVSVRGIVIGTHPVSAVYDTSGGSASPSVVELTVTANKTDADAAGTLAGKLKYQWYKNTVNSNTGGTAISGAASNELATSKISTSEAEDASFYYCDVYIDNDSIKHQFSDVAYVLTSKSKRYFHMSNVAGNKSTSETSIEVTGQKIAGGEVTYYKGTDGKYVLRPNGYGHYFHTSAGSYFKIDLPSGIAANDVISVTVNAIDGSTRGVKISTSSDFTTGHDFTTSTNADTPITMKASDAGLATEATTLYVRGYNNTDGYFTNLTISKWVNLTVTAPTPAAQELKTGDTPVALTVTATGGTGSYTYKWYKKVGSGDGDFTDEADGTNNAATYTPLTESSAKTYYKCKVTSGGVTVWSSAAYVDVKADATHGYFTPDFTSEVEVRTYTMNKKAFTDQNAGDVSTDNHYWLVASEKWSSTSDSGKFILSTNSSNGASDMTFYVKDAKFFSVKVTNKGYKMSIDGGEEITLSASKNHTGLYSINPAGSYIKLIANNTDKAYPEEFIFYSIVREDPTLDIQKDGESVTATTVDQYKGDAATVYEISTNSTGAVTITSDDDTDHNKVTYSYNTTTHELSVTSVNEGTVQFTVEVAKDDTKYNYKKVTFSVKVKTHSLNLSFSYPKATFKAAELNDLPSPKVIPLGQLPTIVAKKDGVTVTDGSELAAIRIKYESDEITNIANVNGSRSSGTYALRYLGGRGGARIYAYIDSDSPLYATHKLDSVAYFDLVVENGTSNNLPDKQKINVQQRFSLRNASGEEVVRLTYGGYKYGDNADNNNHKYTKYKSNTTVTDSWKDATSKGKYFVDGYMYYTRNGDTDATDEYKMQLKGTKDGDGAEFAAMWYQEGEEKPDGTEYDSYERIKPFNLPCRGSYLKFEPKKTGVLTAYVWQNGTFNSDKTIGSKPRLGYWFDQDGWVQHPVGTPVTKQPLSDGWGKTEIKLTSKWDSWTAGKDDADIKIKLQSPTCDEAEPDRNTPLTAFGEGKAYPNPYYWMDDDEVDENWKKPVPTNITPVPYHGGYLVPEATYVKYTLNVVAGKTYYFYGMMTKVGYVGMNFVENENVTVDGKKFYHDTNTLHLKANDNMNTIVTNSLHEYSEQYRGTTYEEVTLPSSYKPDHWYTICLPFALSESQVEEAFGKGTQLTIYNGIIDKGQFFTIKFLSHVDSNILPGQPYLIKPTGKVNDTEYLPLVGDDPDPTNNIIGTNMEVDGVTSPRITFNDVCIDEAQFNLAKNSYGNNTNVNANGVSNRETDYEFTATYSPVTPELHSYIVSKKTGKLSRWEGTSGTLNTYLAYIKPVSSRARGGNVAFSMDVEFDETQNLAEGGDTPTSVISIEDIAELLNEGKVKPANGKAYNMMGQEVDPTSAKGIVIINGKKYMFN